MGRHATGAGPGDQADLCLVSAPYSFSARGPAETCVRLAAGMVAAGLPTRIHAGRVRAAPPPGVEVRAPLAAAARRVPWRFSSAALLRVSWHLLERDLRSADPRRTILHVWPGTPLSVVEQARARGIITVREMINSALATAGPLLDAAYSSLGIPPSHVATPAAIADESAELLLYDYVFASNPKVERSLLEVGVAQERILPTSFGWTPERLVASAGTSAGRPFRALFVGSIGVRKGVPELLDAWRRAGTPGELLLAGGVDDEIAPLVEEAVARGGVRLLGYLDNPADAYADADVFVFPTHEEGGPQVTYEAAGCGLPVVTTPMGAARLVHDGETGLVVEAGDAVALAGALSRLADDPALRRRMGTSARAAADQFDYRNVGARRAEALLGLLDLHR